MATPAVYKQSNVIFSVEGVPMVDIAEDEAITIEYDRDRISKQLDIHEGGIFSLRSGRPAKITVPILQHSRWVSILSDYKNAERMVEVSLADKNDYGNAHSFISAHAMIQDPAIEYGTESSSRSYVFEIIHLSETTTPSK